MRVVSDDGAAAVRTLAHQFEQIRRMLDESLGQPDRAEPPVEVLAVANTADAAHLRSSGAEGGFYVAGPSGDGIVLFTGAADRQRVVFHEYSHLFFNRRQMRLPLWLSEGMADYYSTTAMHGNAITFGQPIASHLQTLQRNEWLDLDRLLSVTAASPEYQKHTTASVFYSESWLLVHMLLSKPGYAEHWQALVRKVSEDVPSARALQESYGRSLKEIAADLRSYLDRAFPSKRVPIESTTQKSAEVRVEQLSDVTGRMYVVDALLALKRTQDAQEIVGELQRQHPANPDVYTAEAELALSEGKDDLARKDLQRAIDLHSTNARTWYDYATLIRDDPAQRQRYFEYLQRSAALDPDYFQTQYLLGYEELRAKRHADSVAHLEKAAQLAPSRAAVWEQLALAYQGKGDLASARRAALSAVNAAVNPPDRERMEALVNDVAQPLQTPSARVEERARVETTPGLRALHSDSSVDGQLMRVDCLGGTARLFVQAGERRLFLAVRDPGAVLMTNAGGRTAELPCGELATPRAVHVAYNAKSDEVLGTVGDVTAIEFR